MNRFMQMLMLFGLWDEAQPAGDGPTGSGVAAPAASDAAVVADPAPSALPDADASAAADPAPDANDPYSLLEQAMRAELGEPATPETPKPGEAKPGEGEPAQVPEQFAAALAMSDYVKSPEQLQIAVSAADEVWKVAAGQLPARTLIEGFKSTNPQQYQAIVQDLTSYIEEVTGKKFGDGPALPPDPNQARLDAIEQRFAQEETIRQQQAWNQQVAVARTKANEFLSSKVKGTFAEGEEGYLLAQIGNKAGIPEQQMVQMLLKGDTAQLEAAYKAVVKDESARLQRYNQNLIKKHRTLSSAVPAVKGGSASTASNADLAPKPGETAIQHATRLWNSGAV